MQNSLAEYVRTMYKKLKKSINVPRFEYGSAGNQLFLLLNYSTCTNLIGFSTFIQAIMTFYLESLASLNAHAELRTFVFHNFTQFGNTIIFALLLEQTLVSCSNDLSIFSFLSFLLETKKTHE